MPANKEAIWLAHGKGGPVPLTGGTVDGQRAATTDHGGGTANVSFYDGHAEVQTVSDLRNGPQHCHLFWDNSGTINFGVN